MGNEICSCLNDLTSNESNDLSRERNDTEESKKINNHPKIVYNKDTTLDSLDPFNSQKEKDTKSATSCSAYKNLTKEQNINDNKNIIELKNNLNNNNNSNMGNKINNINDNIDINDNNSINNNLKNKNTDSLKSFQREPSMKKIEFQELVPIGFKHFMTTPKGEEMILNMDKYPNKLCMTLHKYFLKLITKKHFQKNIKNYKDEGERIFKKCIYIFYESNKILRKTEKNSLIKYTQDGYKKYYPDKNDVSKMIIENKLEGFNNSILIKYSNDDPSTLDNMLWIYKGQVNEEGVPHGFGEKWIKSGMKLKGYWKEGDMYGWGMSIDNKGNIFIGPFHGDEGVTGKGEKFSLKKKVVYKGEFDKGEKIGKGEEISNEGQFIGYFNRDKKNGKGKMIYKITGDIYEGDYKNDLFDGNGHYIWKTTGQEYNGEYKNGLMHGKGLYEWGNDEYYRGNFVNGVKEGEGELHMGNGRIFIGPFLKGRPNGIGIFDNGIDFKGEMEFIDGKMNINYLKRKYSTSSINTINENIIENRK